MRNMNLGSWEFDILTCCVETLYNYKRPACVRMFWFWDKDKENMIALYVLLDTLPPSDAQLSIFCGWIKSQSWKGALLLACLECAIYASEPTLIQEASTIHGVPRAEKGHVSRQTRTCGSTDITHGRLIAVRSIVHSGCWHLPARTHQHRLRNFEFAKFQNFAIMESWNLGILESWSLGILESQKKEAFGLWSFEILNGKNVSEIIE